MDPHADRAGGADHEHPRGPSPGDPHPEPLGQVTARFDSAEQAREAIIALEQAGVEADHVRLDDGRLTNPERSSTWAQDRAVFRKGAGRYVLTGVLGAVAGAAVVIAATMLLVGTGMVVALAAGIGGALFGFWAAAYYGVATKLPVNEEAFDTFGPGEQRTPASLTIDITEPGLVDVVDEVVRDHGASEVQHTTT
jgi:hypothetical protein